MLRGERRAAQCESRDRQHRRAKAPRPAHAARTVIVSMLLRMKPPGFQIGSNPSPPPLSLLQPPAILCSPDGKAGAPAFQARKPYLPWSGPVVAASHV